MMTTVEIPETSWSSSNYDLGAVCCCGLALAVKTSWTEKNPGRRFRCCPKERKYACTSFEWIDVEVPTRAAIVIRGLLKNVKKKDEEISNLRLKVKDNEINQLEVRVKNLERMCVTLVVVVVVLCAIFVCIRIM